MSDTLIQLYQEMADLTKPKCASCARPHSCCSPEYCYFAIETAKERGVKLATTDHPTLPLMGPDGCTCPPQHRPMCTLHVCVISTVGFDISDMKFTKAYFKLRHKIDKEEFRRLDHV